MSCSRLQPFKCAPSIELEENLEISSLISSFYKWENWDVVWFAQGYPAIGKKTFLMDQLELKFLKS